MPETLTEGPEARHSQVQGRERPRSAIFRDWVLTLTWASVIAIDQLSKHLVRANMAIGDSWPAEGFFRITYGTNSGTIFGLFPNQTFVLTIASFFAIAFLVYFYRTHSLPMPIMRVAIGLLLGGAVGNLIDRIRFGTVVDFIDVGPWPIFNLADSSIVVGIAFLVTLSTVGSRGKARKEAGVLSPPSNPPQ